MDARDYNIEEQRSLLCRVIAERGKATVGGQSGDTQLRSTCDGRLRDRCRYGSKIIKRKSDREGEGRCLGYLIVLLLGDPHLLEGGEGGKDRPSDPDGVFALGGCDDLDLHGGGSLHACVRRENDDERKGKEETREKGMGNIRGQ